MASDSSLSHCLRQWTIQLAGCSDSPRLDAEILLKHVSGYDDTQLIINSSKTLEPALVRQTEGLIQARADGWPVAYLCGKREFYALDLKLTREVLIPRPETELLVDSALGIINHLTRPRVLDMGTGSGAIALAIAANAPQARILATDIEQPALDLARENAHRLGLENISFLRSDWYSALARERFDLIVSNPPYIDPEDPHLDQGDVRFEPHRALVSADHGLADIKQIIDLAGCHLMPGGWLALEHGYDQGRAIRAMLAKTGYESINSLRDLNRIERVSMGRAGHYRAPRT